MDAEDYPLCHHMTSKIHQVLCVTICGDNEAHTIHLEGEKVDAAPEHAVGESVEWLLELPILV